MSVVTRLMRRRRERPERSRPTLFVVGVLATVVGGAVCMAVPAQAASAGYVRLAHLSPDTPKVDVYLAAFGGSGEPTVLRGVGYGALSPYQRVPAGRYSVSMRAPGAAADSPPILSTSLDVRPSGSYTVAGVGPNKSVALKVLVDDVAPPSPGNARIRVVQASSTVPNIDVSTTTGLSIAKNAAFPSTTAYSEVPAQMWTLQVAASGGTAPAAVEQQLDVTAGAIYTVLVLDKGQSGLSVVVRKDAASMGRVPVGAVRAGLGGAVPSQPGSPDGVLLTAAVLLLLAAVMVAATPRMPRLSMRR